MPSNSTAKNKRQPKTQESLPRTDLEKQEEPNVPVKASTIGSTIVFLGQGIKNFKYKQRYRDLGGKITIVAFEQHPLGCPVVYDVDDEHKFKLLRNPNYKDYTGIESEIPEYNEENVIVIDEEQHRLALEVRDGSWDMGVRVPVIDPHHQEVKPGILGQNQTIPVGEDGDGGFIGAQIENQLDFAGPV